MKRYAYNKTGVFSFLIFIVCIVFLEYSDNKTFSQVIIFQTKLLITIDNHRFT